MKKKILPVVIAILLIVVIAVLAFGKQILDKYSYSKERYDMLTYFENASSEDAALIMNGSFMEERAYVLPDGGETTCYVDFDTALSYLNDRFYYDDNEDILIYTTAEDMIMVTPGEKAIRNHASNVHSLSYTPFRIENGKKLIALDFVRMVTDFEYTLYPDPYRVKLTTDYSGRTVATARKKTAVRHRGGVKSEILEDLDVGTKVTVLEQMEEWAKVMTEDAVIGYVENKHLTDVSPELPIPSNDGEKYPGYDAEYKALTRDHRIVMGWHAVAGIGGNDTLYAMTENTRGMNVISPTWFHLTDNEGNFESFATQDYVNKAHDMGLEVWALVGNIEHASDLDMKAILSRTSVRMALIDNLINEVQTYGIEGINVDFEMLPTDTGRDFSEFIRELSIRCRKEGIVLSIDNYVPIGGTGYYDRKTQGEVADYVVIMGYDEHYAGSSEAGSVASIGYVETGISMTAEEVPANKIINGIPFYTRIWETEGTEVSSQAVDMATARGWVAEHSLTPEWDEETCQNYATYTSGSKVCECWIEDEESIRTKLNVMKSYNLGGAAFWRLGFEDPEIWNMINEEFVTE